MLVMYLVPILPISYDYSPVYFLSLSTCGTNVILSIAIILFGLSNRRNYGNHLLAFGILYLIGTIFELYWHLFLINPPSWNPPLWWHFPYIYSMLFLVLTGTGYLMFFGQRINENLFIIAGLAYFTSIFFEFFLIIFDYIIYVNDEYLEPGAIFLIIFTLIAIIISSRFIEIGISFKKGIRVFITHAVEDYNRYRISDIAQFLENQKGIRYVYYCEADLMGNIDAWMEKTVPRCQLLIFLSTEKSLKSNDCSTELNLARDKGLEIIPILGIGLKWDDIKQFDIHRELDTEYNPMKFEEFCQKLFLQIQKYTVNKPDEKKLFQKKGATKKKP